jgi:hypothetical protein
VDRLHLVSLVAEDPGQGGPDTGFIVDNQDGLTHKSCLSTRDRRGRAETAEDERNA